MSSAPNRSATSSHEGKNQTTDYHPDGRRQSIERS